MIAIFVCIMIGFLQILLQPLFTPITAIAGLQWFTLLVLPPLMISPLYLQSPWIRSSVDNCVDLIEHLALEKEILPTVSAWQAQEESTRKPPPEKNSPQNPSLAHINPDANALCYRGLSRVEHMGDSIRAYSHRRD
jgi:hypothetical protein